MTDYERGVEQASAVYKEVIREYVAENTMLRERVRRQAIELESLRSGRSVLEVEDAELRHDRDMFRELFHLTTQPDLYVQVRDENAKLRDMLARYIRQAYVQACDKGNPITVGIIEDDARELGIEVPHD